MKIVVNKKITKLDGEVEDLLSTSQTVKETEDIKIYETVIDTSSSFSFGAYSLSEIHIESDNAICVRLESYGSAVVNTDNTTSFSFTGLLQFLNITLQNLSATNKAKIKVLVVV